MGDVDQQRSGRRAVRAALVVAAVLAVAAASAAVVYRVLAPAEVITDATGALPAPAQAESGVIGTLAAAPLIVDGRLRVYATVRQVRADGPVDARTQRSAFWSYRRWPEQVVGVVAVGTTVISRWSDGALVGIDARTGELAWRADGPPPEADHYPGRRTGAAVVYAPDGLFKTGDVVIARGPLRAVDLRAAEPAGAVREPSADIQAFDAASGRRLWRRTGTATGCRTADFTTTAGGYVVADRCVGRVELFDAATGEATATGLPAGEVTPLGCRVGRSQCAGVRAAGAGWLLGAGEPVRAPVLDAAVALVEAVDGTPVAVSADGGGRLAGARADTGEPLWTWAPGAAGADGRAEVIADQPGRLHLLTAGYFLVTVDAATGVEESRFLFTYGRERTGYQSGYAYASDGFVLLERLAPEADPAADDDEYYYIAQPVLLAGT